MAADRCECCGQIIPPPLTPCPNCGHPLNSHNDNGGRNKKAYCTVWVHPDGNPRTSMKQCACTDVDVAR
jgi:uncharacterized OB-fold protein